MKPEHRISFCRLILFALPTIFLSIFSNLYSTVDGIFVARHVDTDALSGINITMPLTYLASALGMMFGSGGNALVAKKIGEGKHQEAREDFSLMMAVAFVFSVVQAVVCFLFLNPLCRFLGSDDALLHYCREYMIPVLISIPFAVFGMVFQRSFITVGKAGLGAFLNVLGGVHFFAKGNVHVAEIALHGFHIVATSFAMMAFNVFASGWFTALNDGKTSAILTFCRTIIFMVIPVLALPRIFETDGVWLSITVGEVLSLAMSIYYFLKFKNMWRAPERSDQL